jgi:hypothetical protein
MLEAFGADGNAENLGCGGVEGTRSHRICKNAFNCKFFEVSHVFHTFKHHHASLATKTRQ